ncbi:MAG: hypothetical protein LBF28_01155 [Rickettsiales bacterium]|jgi:hypothetical protein|nr:hypothetical protein [Rickettsiales bacterium]
MKSLKNAFSKFIIFALALGCAPADSFAAAHDKTLDYECRPRWDRFVVDEKTTNWDKNSIACFDRDGNEIDPVKLYGAPRIYGEFEINAENMAAIARLYGKYDNSKPAMRIKPEPTRAKKSNVKKAAKAKYAAKPKPRAAVATKFAPESEPAVGSRPVAEAVVHVAPDEKAQSIADSLNEKIVTEESYCTQINPPVKGPLPKGLILMPGRPDLICCVRR